MRQTQVEIEQMVLAGPSSNAAVKAMFDASSCVVDGDFFFFVADVMATSVQYGFQADICQALSAGNDTGKFLPFYANYTNSFWTPIFGGADQYS